MTLLPALDRVAGRFYSTSRSIMTPGLQNSQYAYADLLRRSVPKAKAWLDLGCGHELLPSWLRASERHLQVGGCRAVGIDQDLAALQRHPELSLRVGGNIEALPFRDNSFDLITANTVLEHVEDPGRLFGEIARVLAPGGRFIAHGPNSYGYTTLLTRVIPSALRARLAGWLLGRRPEDVYPTYYRANSKRAFQTLAGRSGLVVAECVTVNSSPQFVRVPPLLVLELLLIRMASLPIGARLRACLVVTLEKPAADGHLTTAG